MHWLRQSRFEDFEPKPPAELVTIPLPKQSKSGYSKRGFYVLWGVQAGIWAWAMKDAGLFGLVVFGVVNAIYLSLYLRQKQRNLFVERMF